MKMVLKISMLLVVLFGMLLPTAMITYLWRRDGILAKSVKQLYAVCMGVEVIIFAYLFIQYTIFFR